MIVADCGGEKKNGRGYRMYKKIEQKLTCDKVDATNLVE